MPRLRKQSYQVKCRRLAEKRKSERESETPEEKATRLKKIREQAAARRAKESLEKREMRLARDRARVNATRASLKVQANRASQALQPTLDESSESSNKKQQYAYKAFLRLQAQRELAAKKTAARRRQETPEQRAVRLEKCRVRAAMARACESLEAREKRLTQQRQRIRAVRAYLKQKKTAAFQQAANMQRIKLLQPFFKRTDSENCRLNTMKTIPLDPKIFAYQALMLMEVQRQANFLRQQGLYWTGSPPNTSMMYNSMWTQAAREEEPIEDCVRDSSPPPSIAVECEVSIEEGNELEHIKYELAQADEKPQMVSESTGDQSNVKWKLRDPGGPGFETHVCEPLEIKQEVDMDVGETATKEPITEGAVSESEEAGPTS